MIAGLAAAALAPGRSRADAVGGGRMRTVERGGVRIATEAFGDTADPTVLLIMGATASILGWPDTLCAGLAGHGLHVVRFDHRDTGQSTTAPPGPPAYAVEDMMHDALAVLDAHGADEAHLVGMSLGGLIAQMIAVAYPERAASITLIGSEPLGWDGAPLPHISDEVLARFGRLRTLDWADNEAVTAFMVGLERSMAGTRHPFDAAAARDRVAEVLARTSSPASAFNHAGLGLRDDWTGRFRDIAAPTLVVHGAEDPVLPLPNGAALAEGIPGAELAVLPGVGHELPAAETGRMADLIAGHALSRR